MKFNKLAIGLGLVTLVTVTPIIAESFNTDQPVVIEYSTDSQMKYTEMKIDLNKELTIEQLSATIKLEETERYMISIYKGDTFMGIKDYSKAEAIRLTDLPKDDILNILEYTN